jgi:hypothetical protein
MNLFRSDPDTFVTRALVTCVKGRLDDEPEDMA